MSTALESLLAAYRDHAETEREKGAYFENLSRAYLENDPEMTGQFERVWTYGEWAAAHGHKATDTGVDLVAAIKDDGGFCAIQCKFYAEDHRIQKSDIDSFFTASGKSWFARRLIIDSTTAPWSKNAEDALSNQNPPVTRRSLIDLSMSAIDWSAYQPKEPVKLLPKKSLRPHQSEALEAVRAGLKDADRGKLIMACGTGKTFAGLKIAEDVAGAGHMVLFLVPSLALMAQTVREWTLDAATKLRSFAVCSDVQVGKRKLADDLSDLEIHDLAFPATTNAARLADKIEGAINDAMTVVFATYQSIQVISDAQRLHGLPEFDLIICDEAHRTTGATIAGEDESNFVRIHKQEHVRGKKRLYMTATPRIFGEGAKRKANEHSIEVASMDDPDLYGEVLFHRGFSWAVQEQLLTDYKVIVLAVDEGMVSRSIQQRLSVSNEIQLDDATKIIGCYKALIKDGLKVDVSADPLPMHRALAFCKSIKASKAVESEFAAVVKEYLDADDLPDDSDDGAPAASMLACEVNHVDGTFGAKERGVLLDWLKADAGPDTCRILTNARCLSEGVDVPSLDAIMFLHPRKSQIDVVQSVGRVMRRAEGKNMGYVILPVGVPAGVAPEDALNDNERYKVVWQILNALRAHDERFDATINKIDLGEDVSDRLQIIGVGASASADAELRATTAVVEDLPEKRQALKGSDIGGQSAYDDDSAIAPNTGFHEEAQRAFVLDEFSNAIKAKIVKKCGTRDYWEDWATDIAKIAQNHITRIKGVLDAGDLAAREAFDSFLSELRDDLNDSITEDEAIEMLAQHLITRPVFETLFDGVSFVRENPVSRAMQTVLGALDTANVANESDSLKKFYDSVKWRAQGVETVQGKQRLIVELYDKFFRRAFPRMTERLGIVYTPVEVVDFIIHSVNDVLKSEFGQTLGSKGVHIIDPFTGTGTFITRLMQSGLIKPDEMAHKYRHEIHANEIVLLAYYIAAINIEATYHAVSGADEYEPFGGICLTDTFQLYEQDRDMIADLMPENSDRRTKQKALDIRVIMGNPPYSAGQGSANDNAANVKYPKLDEGIRSTWAVRSSATLKNSLYDSYIRAMRWGADRLASAGGGVMAYVSNGGWIDGNAMDGMRKSLPEEFSSIHVFHLRGNARTSGETRRKEKDSVFGMGTRTPVAISLFVRNPDAAEQGVIRFHDIGDYLSREDKLATIKALGSIDGLTQVNGWQPITPNEHGDWVGQRDDSFDVFMPMGDKKGGKAKLFSIHSAGVKTNRDAWCYNSSKNELMNNMRRMIEFYNSEVDRYKLSEKAKNVDHFINRDAKKISWDHAQRVGVGIGRNECYRQSAISEAVYRPFFKEWIYYDGFFNNRTYQMPRLFPDDTVENFVIGLTGAGGRIAFSSMMFNAIPSLHAADMDGAQYFPLHLYEPCAAEDDLLADIDAPEGYTRRDGITDAGLAHFHDAYPGGDIGKEDLFYYVYGLLHSPDYRERYADTLTKQLPRIPRVNSAADFWVFSKAGRRLGDLHVNYESVEPYPVAFGGGALLLDSFTDADFRVEKMKFAGKRGAQDKTTVIYNPKITMTGIPLEAYDYIVNGKPALEWVMERQGVHVDKHNPEKNIGSGIVNDANRYAIETVGDARYPLILFQRVITVSLETMKIVRALPRLDFNTLT